MIINSFFHGKKLNLLNHLTISSFLKNGHIFNLFCYNENITDFKDAKFNIFNASEILEEKKLFLYTGNGDCPSGSVSGFSDIFRFYLLLKKLGWYVDMDVTCLKSFEEFQNVETVFRPNKNYGAVANIIKSENKAFIESVIDEYEKNINEKNDEWVKPINIFYNQIKKFNLENCIIDKNIFGNDDAVNLMDYIEKNIYELHSLPTHAIHWCNTACTTSNWNIRLKIDWDAPRLASLYYCLLKKYNLVK